MPGNERTPTPRPGLGGRIRGKEFARDLEQRNREMLHALRGDVALRAREENTPPSISERVGYIIGSQRNSLARPTQTQRDAYAIASEKFRNVLGRLRTLIDARRMDRGSDTLSRRRCRAPRWDRQFLATVIARPPAY